MKRKKYSPEFKREVIELFFLSRRISSYSSR